jgi:hypothetical protein
MRSSFSVAVASRSRPVARGIGSILKRGVVFEIRGDNRSRPVYRLVGWMKGTKTPDSQSSDRALETSAIAWPNNGAVWTP